MNADTLMPEEPSVTFYSIRSNYSVLAYGGRHALTFSLSAIKRVERIGDYSSYIVIDWPSEPMDSVDWRAFTGLMEERRIAVEGSAPRNIEHIMRVAKRHGIALPFIA